MAAAAQPVADSGRRGAAASSRQLRRPPPWGTSGDAARASTAALRFFEQLASGSIKIPAARTRSAEQPAAPAATIRRASRGWCAPTTRLRLAPMHCSQPRRPAVSSCSVVQHSSPRVLLRTLESSSFAHPIELATPDRCRWPRRRARSAVSSCARCTARAFTCTALLSLSHAVCVKAILRCPAYVYWNCAIVILPQGGGHKCCQQPGRDTGAKDNFCRHTLSVFCIVCSDFSSGQRMLRERHVF